MSQRYQKEIEEILEQVNEEPPRPGRGGSSQSRGDARLAPPRPPRSSSRFGLLQVSPGRLMLIGLASLFIALISLSLLPMLAAPSAWVGIGLFIVAYVLFFLKPRRTVERRWRGQLIEDEPGDNGLTRFWRWVTRG
jgi:hypothetical protein